MFEDPLADVVVLLRGVCQLPSQARHLHARSAGPCVGDALTDMVLYSPQLAHR
jgi:hypothetical protein